MAAQATRSRRAELEARRRAEQQAARRRRLILVAVLVVVTALAVVAVVTLVPSSGSQTPALSSAPSAASGPAPGADLPPWPAPADPQRGIQAAGLVSNPMEGAAQHFHAHLNILVNGEPVEVPADLGIDERRGVIAELHTHDDSGILHVESGSRTLTFTLGQLFVEWGVKLDAHDLGGLRNGDGKELHAYVDGTPVTGDPADIQLANHQEIALVYGSGAPADVPRSYDFAAAGL